MPRARTAPAAPVRQRLVQDSAGDSHLVEVNPAESPISWLHSRGLLSDRLYDAAEAVRRDWEIAGLAPRVTMRWDATPPGSRGGGEAMTDWTTRRIAARDRLDGALAVAGPGLNDILWRVVCAGEGLKAAERALGWPMRSGKLVLTLALQRVADYYRLPGG